MITLREDVQCVVDSSLADTQPQTIVRRSLSGLHLYGGKLLVFAIGDAAWGMAKGASDVLGTRINQGLVITRYGSSGGLLPHFSVMEAGQPMPDENSVRAADAAIGMVQGLNVEDTVLVLLSGGGSSLFEKPLVPLPLFATTLNALMHCGATHTEINMLRKRLSAVKGGRFAKLCAPARVVGLLLSDVPDNAPETIASGPISPDPITSAQAEQTLYRLLPDAPLQLRVLMRRETPKTLSNAETRIVGDVGRLVRATSHALQRLGYETVVLTDRLDCAAREAGRFLGSMALTHQGDTHSIAFIAGGNSTVGGNSDVLAGHNLTLALAAAPALDGLRDTAVFSFTSEGFDGGTDAAGGIVDCRTMGRLRAIGMDIDMALNNNDCYRALRASDGLIITGSTGNKLNDVSVMLIRR